VERIAENIKKALEGGYEILQTYIRRF